MNPPPLIVHVIYALDTGGMENGLVNIINRAPADRYRHAIVCLTRAHAFSERISQAGVTLYELNKKDGHDPGAYFRFWKLLRKLKPAIVHTRNLATLEYQFLAFLAVKSKRVHGEHGRDTYDLDGKNRKYLLFRKFLRRFIHCYITVSQDLANWLTESVQVRPELLRLIYNGVDQSTFCPSEPKERQGLPQNFLAASDCIVVGMVGRIAAVKDQQLAILALSQILEAYPELRTKVRLVMVGDGPLRLQFEKIVVEKGLEDIVWVTGDRDDVSDLLKSFDIFMQPSLAEGISNTVLEAMATALPVIASDTGGNPELVQSGHNGFLFPVGDVESLEKALLKLLGSRELRQQFGDKSLEAVSRKFHWASTVEEYLATYDELLGLNHGFVSGRSVG